MIDTFGKKLAMRRAVLGMTQRELGAAAKVSWSQISRYEADKARPRLSVLLRIEKALGVKHGELFPDDEQPETLEVALSADHHEFFRIQAEKLGISVEDAFQKIVLKLIARTADELEGRETPLITKDWDIPDKKFRTPKRKPKPGSS